jgi:hypothetical protein
VPTKTKQYTIRKVPASVDQALRQKAKARGLSLNAFINMLLKQEAYWLNNHAPLLAKPENSKLDRDWEHN